MESTEDGHDSLARTMAGDSNDQQRHAPAFEGMDEVEEAMRLASELCLIEDPPEEPFRSKYKARDALKKARRSLTETGSEGGAKDDQVNARDYPELRDDFMYRCACGLTFWQSKHRCFSSCGLCPRSFTAVCLVPVVRRIDRSDASIKNSTGTVEYLFHDLVIKGKHSLQGSSMPT